MYGDLYFIENLTFNIDGRGYAIELGDKVIPPYGSGNSMLWWAGAFPAEIQLLIDGGYVRATKIQTI